MDMSELLGPRKIRKGERLLVDTPEKMRQARTDLGLTQIELAEALLLSANGGRTIRRWEQGTCPIPPPVAILIGIWLDHASLRPRPSKPSE